ncbi:helix-turn-helix domain-containing protein [Micromonospora sp. NPDC005174]|uniref:helix-turn-helix domain-containing protein n=1 Tax=Micromonospora sp. NPDC005174 TaxID=3157018 RepID=UPI0033B221E2
MVAEEMHTVAELAKAWRCSKNFIYDLISDGKLRSVDLTNSRAKTRVPASAVKEYLTKQTRKPLRSAA